MAATDPVAAVSLLKQVQPMLRSPSLRSGTAWHLYNGHRNRESGSGDEMYSAIRLILAQCFLFGALVTGKNI